MTSYYVIAPRWDDKKQKTVKYIAGTFADFMCAALFREAYCKTFHTDVVIVDSDGLLEKKF